MGLVFFVLFVPSVVDKVLKPNRSEMTMAFPFQAVLFDMDGTITNNHHLHGQAWHAFALQYAGITLEPNDARLHGGTTVQIIENLLGRSLDAKEAEELHDAKEVIYRTLASGQLQHIEGLLVYLERLKELNIPTAVVTNAVGENLPFTLRELGLEKAFDICLDGSMAPNAKPAPDLYFLACERLNAEPWECLVHEDSSVGIRAGRAASCRVAAITTGLSEEQCLELGANWASPDFTEWMKRVVWSTW